MYAALDATNSSSSVVLNDVMSSTQGSTSEDDYLRQCLMHDIYVSADYAMHTP